MLNTARTKSYRAQRGLGLVELMVGITVGLIVTAGAAVVATRQINEHRRLMLEVQMQQDLRIAADLLQQDMRRAGYRGLPSKGVWEPERNAGATPAKEAASSPYTALTQTTAGGSDLFYRYAKKANGILNVSNIVSGNEQFGVKLEDETLSIALGLLANGAHNWQPITDPNVVRITNFAANIVTQQIPLDDLCDPSCTSAGTCPTQSLRTVNFTIRAVARADPSVVRTLTVSEKIRADDISGECPA
ncbi:PilW family protein [Pelomonas sp. Root1237]|uniref:PilW family protein n=1 Tax=Pelomonas sp. Root1237 TaxID=1736434 RepID=UPI000A989126|nr:prepilin-type N-terminal cleavage/methylation domain-containing protein [Pelomonas sp. Root1237]